MAENADAIPLIRTKLQRPQLPGDLIPRRRLLGRLHAGLTWRLTVISAMAGMGKIPLTARSCGSLSVPSRALQAPVHVADQALAVLS